MNVRKSFVSIVTAMVTAAGVAGAQTTVAGADPLYKLDPNTRRQIEALRDSANAAGLPGRQLVLKALQGYAMKADPKKIVTVVRQLYVDLRAARGALETDKESELTAAATALTSKITVSELEQFHADAHGRSPLTALVGLTTMIAQGVPRDDAVGAFLKLWKNGSIDDDFQLMLRRIDQDIHSGVSPSVALTQQAAKVPPRPPREEEPENPRA